MLFLTSFLKPRNSETSTAKKQVEDTKGRGGNLGEFAVHGKVQQECAMCLQEMKLNRLWPPDHHAHVFFFLRAQWT